MKKTKVSKRLLSLLLSALMIVTSVPIIAMPVAVEAEDAPASAYWSILASTDFTGTSWSGSGDSWYTSSSPRTTAGGNSIGWSIKYGTRSSDEVLVDSSNGVEFDWVSDNERHQGMMYMSSYNGQTTNTIFNGISNFKIDLAFSFLGTAKCNTGYNLDGTRNDVPLIKLANDSSNKYSHRSQYNHQSNYFLQTMWGERSVNSTDYYVDGDTTETDGTTTGGKWAITTSDNNASSVLTSGNVYHYVVYVADNMLGTYVTDDSGNVLINYNPIEIASFNLSPSVISSIYLGASEFNWAGKYDVENIAYKSIEIYQGNDTSTYDSTRDKFLYAYFTGDTDAGETMHYAISQDGINFEAVSGGVAVWNPANYPATETYPATDSAPYSDSVAISNHVRDSYAFIGQDGKDYVIATDLNTNNGSWGSIQNSRFLMWKMDNFGDIADTRPWSIDTANLPGMDDITGGVSDGHETVKKAWAPQVIWDADEGKYMLYWAVGADDIDTQIYYTYTSDFKTDFTAPQRLMYPDFDGEGITNHIDADITYHNGLYYCYFKNEDSTGTGAKRVWYAVAPNANGPYTDFELINTSYGAEGPQVYEIADGSYMLMIDGYGDHTYHMYSAGSPYEFDISDETTTNVSGLSPRHGSIVRISTAEYNKLKKLRIGSELRYAWETTGNYSHNTTQTDSTGNSYQVTWNPNSSTTTTGSGVLTLTDSGIYSKITDVQNYIGSDVYTVTFYYKSTDSSFRDDNHSIFSISNSDSVTNYVRLSANGNFYVNGSGVTPSGTCSDGTTTRAAKLSSAVADESAFHRYTITSDGLITSLIIDGEFICQTISGMDIPNTLWITFGWARMTTYENNRLTAQFGTIVFKNVATETDKQDELYDSLKPTSAAIAAGTFNATAYHEGNAAHRLDGQGNIIEDSVDGEGNPIYNGRGYSNVVYCSSTTGWNSSYQNKFYVYFKIALPSTIVLVYDGVNDASLPAVFENYRGNNSSQNIKAVECTTSHLDFQHNWYGYTDKNTLSNGNGYQAWPGNYKPSNSCNSQFGYTSGTQVDSDTQNNNTNRFWWNRLYYTGNMTSDGNTIYSETFSNPSFWIRGYSSSWNVGNQETSWNAENTTTYVINYKLVYDILKADSTEYIDINGSESSINIASLYASDAANRWMYTKESYAQALYAMKLLADCNPNNYDYSSDPAGAITSYIADMQKAVDAFDKINLVKNTFTVTYRMADGGTASEVVTAGNTLSSVPSNTADFHITDTNTHKKNCAWSSVTHSDVPSGAAAYNPAVTPSGSVVPQADTIYTETGTIEACNGNGASNAVAASGDINSYTDYACSVCGYTDTSFRVWGSQDWRTYNAEVALVPSVKALTKAYTAASLAAYTEATDDLIASVDTTDQSRSQAYIDRQISNLQHWAQVYDATESPYGLLAYIPYTVNFNVFEDGNKNTTLSSTATYHYGDEVNLEYTGTGYNVYLWEKTADNTTREYRVQSKSIGSVVGISSYTGTGYDSITCNVYCTSGNEAADEDVSKVTMLTKTGNIGDIQYVDNGTYTVVIEKSAGVPTGKLTLDGSTEYEFYAQTSAFLNIDSFQIGNTTLTDGQSITIEGSTNIKPQYSAISLDLTISYGDGIRNSLNNESGSGNAAQWDQKIVATGGKDTTTAWYYSAATLGNQLIGYGSSLQFRMCNESATVTKVESQTEAAVTNIIYATYGGYRENAITLVGKYYVPSGSTLTETGVIILKNTDREYTDFAAADLYTGTADSMTVNTANGARKMQAKNLTDSSQFLYNLNNSSGSAFSMGVVMYMKYNNGSAEKYVYSPVYIVNSDGDVSRVGA